MGRPLIDITGQRFARIAILHRVKSIKGHAFYLCRCDCGVVKTMKGIDIRNGKIKSCGCLRKDRIISYSTTHGLRNTSENAIWQHMMQRCTNPKNKNYLDYGGRGITVCERWYKFENFFADMGNRPSPKHSIERKNNSGNYEPENCEWATQKEQANNKRSNRIIEFNGQSKNLAQWSESLGWEPSILWARLYRYHWPIHRALTEKPRHY